MISFDEHHLWHNLHLISHAIARREENVLSKTEITYQQYGILLAMAFLTETTKAPIKITDLAPFQNRSLVSISLIIDRMESKGLVKKLRDPTDRRVVRVTITEKGGKLLKITSKPTTELITRLFSTLSDKDVKQAVVLTDKLMGILGLASKLNKTTLKNKADFINKLSQ